MVLPIAAALAHTGTVEALGQDQTENIGPHKIGPQNSIGQPPRGLAGASSDDRRSRSLQTRLNKSEYLS